MLNYNIKLGKYLLKCCRMVLWIASWLVFRNWWKNSFKIVNNLKENILECEGSLTEGFNDLLFKELH